MSETLCQLGGGGDNNLDASAHTTGAVDWTDLAHEYLVEAERAAEAQRAMQQAIVQSSWTLDPEVEILTFEPAPGAQSRSAFGHTAVCIAGMTYSFNSGGWFVEEAQAFMARNTIFRSGGGQVLNLEAGQALAIVNRILADKAAGTEYSFLSGVQCVSRGHVPLSGGI
jgi:hypothetical protein